MLIDFYIANVELGSNYILQPNLSALLYSYFGKYLSQKRYFFFFK